MAERVLADVLAPVLLDDGGIDLVALGEIEQAHRHAERLSPEDEAARNAVLHHPDLGGRCLVQASQRYIEHCGEQVRRGGGTITTVSTRLVDERTVRTHRLERFAGRIVGATRRPVCRPRGGGRPKGRSSRSSSRSGDSGDSGLAEPPGLRPSPLEGVAA